jgi:hypothetical protein
MASPVTFTRIYTHGSGPEHPATPQFVSNVLHSMNEAASGDVPFKVLLRMDDGSTVLAKPKGRR